MQRNATQQKMIMRMPRGINQTDNDNDNDNKQQRRTETKDHKTTVIPMYWWCN